MFCPEFARSGVRRGIIGGIAAHVMRIQEAVQAIRRANARQRPKVIAAEVPLAAGFEGNRFRTSAGGILPGHSSLGWGGKGGNPCGA